MTKRNFHNILYAESGKTSGESLVFFKVNWISPEMYFDMVTLNIFTGEFQAIIFDRTPDGEANVVKTGKITITAALDYEKI